MHSVKMICLEIMNYSSRPIQFKTQLIQHKLCKFTNVISLHIYCYFRVYCLVSASTNFEKTKKMKVVPQKLAISI